MKSKWIIFASLLLTLALVFTGCGGGEDSKDKEEEDGTKVTDSAIVKDEDEALGEADGAQDQDGSQAASVEGQQVSGQKTETKPEQKPANTTQTQKPANNPAPEQKPATQSQPEPQPAQEPAPAPAPEPEPAPSAPTKSDASAYIGRSKSSLVSGIGAPNSSSYSPSCMGEGEDGELKYNGFTVFTYRENGSETVTDVM